MKEDCFDLDLQINKIEVATVEGKNGLNFSNTCSHCDQPIQCNYNN